MEWIRRGTERGNVVALFPGAWNPPTRAHLGLAEAALTQAGEVVFVLPRAFPHKLLEGPELDRRLCWLTLLAEANSAFSVALSDGGLFLEMAREFRALQPAARTLLLCGTDAAHRIVTWPYQSGDTIESQLDEYELLVAPRPVVYQSPAHLQDRIHPLDLPEDYRLVSSTEARERIQRGDDARSLVPEMIWDDVLRCYSR